MSGDGLVEILIIGIVIIIFILLGVLAVMYFKEKNKQKSEETVNSPENKDDKSNKKSVFRFMEFDNIEDNMIVQDGGTRYLMVIECKGINYDLLSGIEKTSVEQGFLQFLNTLKYEIQIYIQTRKINLNQSIITYKEKVEKIKQELRYEEAKLEDMQRMSGYSRDEVLKQIKEVTKKRNLYEYAQDLIQSTEKMSEDRDITTKQYYIVIPYYTEEITSVGDYDKREISSMAFSELYTRAQSIANGLAECEIRGRILNSQELIELLYVAYNREQYDIYDFETYLSESGYQSLYSVSEDVLNKRMKAIDEEIVRKAKQKAVYAYELASDEVRKKASAIQEKENKMQEAVDCFKAAQTLPQNLGAGLWNIVRLVPFKYYEAICLKSLGQEDKANENFDFITGIEVDYFSNMNLPELPFYQALCYRETGMPFKGDMLINYKLQDWKEGMKTVDAGYFATTPFFISFCDRAVQQRSAYYSYLLALAYRYTGDTKLAQKYIEQAAVSDPYALNIFAERQF